MERQSQQSVNQSQPYDNERRRSALIGSELGRRNGSVSSQGSGLRKVPSQARTLDNEDVVQSGLNSSLSIVNIAVES